ncbi:MAG: hypothetical protein Q8S02_08365 [Hydrogenophaga sp.]|nr:hypothetical protein [Hydrogenophaga sp.]
MRRCLTPLLSLHLWLGVVVVAWAGFGVAAAPSGHLADVPALSQMAVELIHTTVAMEPAAAAAGVDVPSEWPQLLQATVLAVACVGLASRPGVLRATAWVAPLLDGPRRPPRNTRST